MQGIDVIILIIVAVLLLIALYGSIRHFKGEGPCCGGTSSRKSQEKQLMRPVIGRKSLRISGMHCENCADHVARALLALGVQHGDRVAVVMDVRGVRNSDQLEQALAEFQQ